MGHWLRTQEGGIVNLDRALSVTVRPTILEAERRVVESVEKSKTIPAKVAWDVYLGLDTKSEILLASYEGDDAEKKAMALFEGVATWLGASGLEGLEAEGGRLTEVSEPGRVMPLEETVLRGPRAKEETPPS